MTEQEAIKAIENDLKWHSKELKPKYKEVLKFAIKALENQIEEWHILTDDEESYPDCFEYVLVEDDIGDRNVACCYPDYDWHISNGENSLKLIGEVIKWRRL